MPHDPADPAVANHLAITALIDLIRASRPEVAMVLWHLQDLHHWREVIGTLGPSAPTYSEKLDRVYGEEGHPIIKDDLHDHLAPKVKKVKKPRRSARR